MKSHNIVVYLIIPLALFSTLLLFDNVEAQTNSTTANQTTSQQQLQQPQNQNANLTAQALMKTDIVKLKNTLMNAKLAIVDGNIKQALEDVRNVETELLFLEPSQPTKFLNNIHKAIGAIAKSEIDKSLNILTNIEVSILKAENLIFKAAVTNPQMIQQVKDSVVNPQQMNPIDTEQQYDPVEQYDNVGLNTNLVDFSKCINVQ